MSDYPFMRRDWIYNSAVSLGTTGLALLNLEIQLDIRDLLNKISMVASVDGKAEIVTPEDYIMFQDKQMEVKE